jgi:biopolymer transport protein ExbD
MDHWEYVVQSREYSMETISNEIKTLAESAMDSEINPAAGKRMSKRKINVRADKYAPYGHVQQLITLCGVAGIFMVEVSAARPPTDKK